MKRLYFGILGVLSIAVLLMAQSVFPPAGGGATPAQVSLAPVAIGSIAAAGTAGRLYPWFVDSPLIARDNGSSWDYALPGVGPITRPPSISGYTAVNSATIADQNGGFSITGPASAGANVRFAYKTAGYPGTPFTWTIGVIPNLPGDDFAFSGIGISDGTKYIIWGPSTDSAGGASTLAELTYWTNATLLSSRVMAQWIAPGQMVFLTVTDNGTNLLFYQSNNINDLTSNLATSVSRTAFLTPSRIGPIYNFQTSFVAKMLILHWTGI